MLLLRNLYTELDVKTKHNKFLGFLVSAYEKQIKIRYIRQHHQMAVVKDTDT
jgi:hypothetical protein